MLKKYALFLFIALSVWACKKGSNITGDVTPAPVTPVAIDSAVLTSVKIEAKNNPGKITADITCTISNGEITALLPDYKYKKLALTYAVKNKGTNIKVGDTLQVSGVTITDFTKPTVLSVVSASGVINTYTVKFKVFTGLPIIYITSAGPIVSKDVYVKGSVLIDPNMGVYPQEVTRATMQIKGHGNSTWVLPEFKKKPYKIKFDSKTVMLGMASAKDWVLLANYNDKTLMRNRLALLLAKRLGSDFAPDCRYVEVVLNGDFVGNYLLTPQVEVNANRVNIPELTDKNTADDEITGGYLLEVDQKKDAKTVYTSAKGLPFGFKSPEVPTAKQLAYITKYIQDTENSLYAANFADPTNGYPKYINSDSFINWYFVNEVMENEDTRDFSSIFYYKDRGGKLGMGPVWDFDISSGNIDYSPAVAPTGIWYIRDGPWFTRLEHDPIFNLKVRKRWADIRSTIIQQVLTDVDQTALELKLSQEQNFKRWPTLDKYVWPNAVVLGTYDKEVAYLKDFLTKRIAWMDANMSAW